MEIKDILKEQNECVLYENDLVDILLYRIMEKSNNHEICIETRDKLLGELCSFYNRDLSELLDRYEWLTKLELDPNLQLEKNHHIVYEIFDKFNTMAAEHNIENYCTSGILAYLLVGSPLERYHHDLDIFVNMEDLSRLEAVASQYNFSFNRKIGVRGDGTNRRILKMYYEKYIDVPITVFMYVRENDGSITQKDYFFNSENELMVENMYNSRECAELSFSDKIYYHNSISYKAISLEALYLSKKGNRLKDIYDCQKFEASVDRERLGRLENALLSNRGNEVIDTEKDKYRSFILAEDKPYAKKLVGHHD